MINLLPGSLKEGFRYGRRNTTLRQYAIWLFIGLLGTVVMLALGVLYMQWQIKGYDTSIQTTEESLTAQNETEFLAQASDINDSLTLAVEVLSNEVLFSKLLKQIGTIMPNGTNLQSLTMDSSLTGALDLTVYATTYTNATQVQVNLSDSSNGVFKQADLISIDTNNDEDSPYNYIVNLRALFADDNDFFLTSQAEQNS